MAETCDFCRRGFPRRDKRSWFAVSSFAGKLFHRRWSKLIAPQTLVLQQCDRWICMVYVDIMMRYPKPCSIYFKKDYKPTAQIVTLVPGRSERDPAGNAQSTLRSIPQQCIKETVRSVKASFLSCKMAKQNPKQQTSGSVVRFILQHGRVKTHMLGCHKS